MKRVIFKGEFYNVMDETNEFYICEPKDFCSGYDWISKNKAVEVKEGNV